MSDGERLPRRPSQQFTGARGCNKGRNIKGSAGGQEEVHTFQQEIEGDHSVARANETHKDHPEESSPEREETGDKKENNNANSGNDQEDHHSKENFPRCDEETTCEEDGETGDKIVARCRCANCAQDHAKTIFCKNKKEDDQKSHSIAHSQEESRCENKENRIKENYNQKRQTQAHGGEDNRKNNEKKHNKIEVGAHGRKRAGTQALDAGGRATKTVRRKGDRKALRSGGGASASGSQRRGEGAGGCS